MVSSHRALDVKSGIDHDVSAKLPFTPAIVYLVIGFLLGPSVLSLFYFDPIKQSALLEVLTEVAVLIALFSAGVKMPVPIELAHWRAPLRACINIDDFNNSAYCWVFVSGAQLTSWCRHIAWRCISSH